MTARIFAISKSIQKGTRKTTVRNAELRVDYGIVGDAHAAPGPRQVSLLALEAIEAFCKKGGPVFPGDFAENITTQGFDLSGLKVGDQIQVGETVVLEISQIGKTCHSRCEIAKQVGNCIMPKQGIFSRVLQGGQIKVDDRIHSVIFPKILSTSLT